jgi:hypothetical protein
MFDFLLRTEVFRRSLKEQKAALGDFWGKAGQVLSGSGVELKPIPAKWTTLRHNYFSVLFIAAFFALEVPVERLRLYARINHCLRAWVTACDNLLDDELKEIIKTDLPEGAKVFKSVHTIMVADRVFFRFLLDALHGGVISREEMEKLIGVSLSAISASGKEEAGEEAGADRSMSPDDVLYGIHADKTGRLFTAPLAAPASLGDIGGHGAAGKKVESIRKGLFHFGLGCQILDDINDIGMDLCQRKYNYLAALVIHGKNGEEKKSLETLKKEACRDEDLYKRFPAALGKAKKEMAAQFKTSLKFLSVGGLPLGGTVRPAFINALMAIFRRPDLMVRLRG